MIIDASSVERENRGHLNASPYAARNLRFIAMSVDLLKLMAELDELTSGDEVTLLRLAVRLINSAGACGNCAVAGFYQPAVANLRDIVEVTFLVDLFLRSWRAGAALMKRCERKNFGRCTSASA